MGDPFSSQMRALINKQNMFQVQQELPKTQRARGIGRATFSRLTYLDPFTYAIIQDYRSTGENAWTISFDGVDDSIALGNDSVLNNLDDFTISMWIYPKTMGTSTPHLFIKGYPSANGIICFFSGGVTTPWNINLRVLNDAAGFTNTASNFIGSNINQWYHIVARFQRGTKLQSLFINGILRDSDIVSGTVSPNLTGGTASMSINGGGGAAKWGGLIQDFRLWRSALSDSEALDLYEGDYIGITPDYWLRMNEGSGNPYDVVGGTLQGTLTNGAAWSVAPQSPMYRYFMPPIEPDGKYLTCWIPMKSMGRYLEDLSCFRNHAYLKGKPKFCKGPDDGLFGGRPALEFNHTSGQNDFLYVPHSSKLDTSTLLTGICIFSRVKFNDFTQDGGIDATVFQKIDNTSASAGFALRVGTDGKLKWYPRRASSTFDHITAANTVVLDKIYDIGCRYTLSGNTTELHVDGVSKADTGNQPITFPLGDTTDMRICIGDNANAGRCSCNFYDFRVYYEYLISTAEWLNLYTNKRSISPIPYRLVAAEGITQVEFKPPFTAGFSAGFTH
jgi:hypothetical protein